MNIGKSVTTCIWLPDKSNLICQGGSQDQMTTTSRALKQIICATPELGLCLRSIKFFMLTLISNHRAVGIPVARMLLSI